MLDGSLNAAAHCRALEFRPSSLDLEARTFEATIATTAPVRRGGVDEILAIQESAVDLSRMPVPLLDSHRVTSTADVLGMVESVRVSDGALVARIRVSRGEAGDGVLAKIADGTLRGVSVGYRVLGASNRRLGDGRTERLVERWLLAEVSLVPLPADAGATIRNEEGRMPETETTSTETPSAGAVQTPAVNRAEINREIRSLAQTAGLDRDWADGQIDVEASLDDARRAAFDAMRTRSSSNIRSTRAEIGTSPSPERQVEGMAEALACRHDPTLAPSDAARPYLGHRLLDMAATMLQTRGISTSTLSTAELCHRALTTGDLPLLADTTVNRELRRRYEAQEDGLRMTASQRTVTDFRETQRIQISSAPEPEEKPEGGKYHRGPMSDAAETLRLKTYGKMACITREMIVNDDLGAIPQFAAAMAVASRNFENRQLAEKIEANPSMNDGNALFSAAHGNLAANGAALDEATLSVARLSMRKQTALGPDGETAGHKILATPRYVIVPPELETAAEKLLSTVQAQRTADVNPFAELTLVVDNHLSDPAAWYVSAAPTQIDGLEYAYLAGAPGPQTETRIDFDSDNLEVKIRLDFGCAFVDWRSWYKNPGV